MKNCTAAENMRSNNKKTYIDRCRGVLWKFFISPRRTAKFSLYHLPVFRFFPNESCTQFEGKYTVYANISGAETALERFRCSGKNSHFSCCEWYA